MRTQTLLTCFLFVAWSSFEPTTAAETKPNIIVILADDLGYGDLGVARQQGDPDAAHRFDRRGRRALHERLRLGPVCSPTRAGLLTGRYQQRFGHEFNPGPVANGGNGQGLPLDRDDARRSAQGGRLRDGADRQMAPRRRGRSIWPNARGFDEFFGFLARLALVLPERRSGARPDLPQPRAGRSRSDYLTRRLGRRGVPPASTSNRERPFFLYLAFNAVHTPMEAPETTLAKFADVADEKRRTYPAMLAELDDAVGRVLDKAAHRDRLEERTLVFFLSDNGGPTTKYSPNGATTARCAAAKAIRGRAAFACRFRAVERRSCRRARSTSSR